MTAAVDTEQHDEIDTGERTVLVRTFAAELSEGDGRTLDIRIAPYNVAALVADPPTFRPYREMFVPGVFERQVAAPDRVRVWLNFEHDKTLAGVVGHGIQLRDRSDALEGSFRVHENPDGEKALQLVRDGLLTGASLEYIALRSRRVDGVVQRLRAHIDRVALVRSPAFASAGVLAVREDALVDEDDVDDEEHASPPAATPALSADLTERLVAVGVEPLRRMAVSSKAWDGSPARFSDEQYERSTLFCRPGEGSPKERCSLPVLEPDGALNVNALGAAAAALSGARGGLASVTRAQKASAARKLIRYYNAARQEPPAGLVALARS